MHVDRNASPVVRDGHTAVRVERDLDVLAEARHRLVDRVVHDLMDEVVETPGIDASHVHRGALPDGLKTFEDLDLLRGIRRRFGALFDHRFRNSADGSNSPNRTHPARRRVNAPGLYKYSAPISME
jgi:hypothetical protein